MKNYLYTIFVVFLLTQNADAQAKNLDSIRMSFMIQRDTLSLASLIDDSLIYLHSNGLKESKADFIHSIAANKIVYERMDMIDKKQIRYDAYFCPLKFDFV